MPLLLTKVPVFVKLPEILRVPDVDVRVPALTIKLFSVAELLPRFNTPAPALVRSKVLVSVPVRSISFVVTIEHVLPAVTAPAYTDAVALLLISAPLLEMPVPLIVSPSGAA